MTADPDVCACGAGRSPGPCFSRRRALGGAGVVALSGAALAACATDGDPAEDQAPPEGDGSPVARTSDIPVGSGAVYEDAEVVITQPDEGRFQGFSAVCTHQGCTVGDVSEGTINCPCHGSRFAIADGSVVAGPADAPLPEQPLSIDGDEISLG